ncbi:MAG: GNAT family N-acetyltransferase [Tolypothrix sp. Co-bin9]|nr:GNAT family N-acetyltransferase [Tolypothrix sp. Co-bin9]
MSFLPENFEIPEILKTDYFFLRSITLHDVVKDYDAVMSSREYLWQRFSKIWGWPPEDLTLEQDLIDLAWHQKEFQLRRSFNYAVMSLDETRLLGCAYIDPPNSEEYDAEVYYWVRSSELASGLDDYLGDILRNWIATSLAFIRVEYPG